LNLRTQQHAVSHLSKPWQLGQQCRYRDSYPSTSFTMAERPHSLYLIQGTLMTCTTYNTSWQSSQSGWWHMQGAAQPQCLALLNWWMAGWIGKQPAVFLRQAAQMRWIVSLSSSFSSMPCIQTLASAGCYRLQVPRPPGDRVDPGGVPPSCDWSSHPAGRCLLQQLCPR